MITRTTVATPKAQALNAFLSSLAGRDRETTIGNGTCMSCGGSVRVFKDEKSWKEFTISGLCQTCQDKIFG